MTPPTLGGAVVLAVPLVSDDVVRSPLPGDAIVVVPAPHLFRALNQSLPAPVSDEAR
jgi:hypothetical protein